MINNNVLDIVYLTIEFNFENKKRKKTSYDSHKKIKDLWGHAPKFFKKSKCGS
jgi:hypothetical protein